MTGTRLLWVVALAVIVLTACAHAQATQGWSSIDTFQSPNVSFEQLIPAISPSVVHIEVSSYGPLSAEGDDEAKVQTLTKQHGSGSGVIVSPDGYIVTARHVVEGARRIRVELDSRAHAKTADSPSGDETSKLSFEARIIGAFKDADVAVLKISAQDLSTISFSEGDCLKQGQLVAALGSPEGLRSSLSLGVVSSVSRQIEPDDVISYIQTDTALAPGSSGSPLVNLQGEMVGMNVFTLTDGGREHGLGFAVPSAMVRFVYEQIRQYGSVPRVSLGVDIQGITATLARALHLPSDSGVIAAGSAPRTLGGASPLQAGDVLLAIDGTHLRNVSQLSWVLLHKHPGDHLGLEIWRRSSKILVDLALVGASDDSDDSLANLNIEANLVAKLGIVGSSEKRRDTGPTAREPRPGVLVVAKLRGTDNQAELAVGDLIRSVNSVAINSVAQLRTVFDSFQAGDAIALQIERKGKLLYLAFEMD